LDSETSVDESFLDSGKRVSNTWVICLEVGNSSPKGGVIFDGSSFSKEIFDKAFALQEEPASYQLVGEVKAHQG
jgi:hypothetical protein